jgi:hypothetical protein
MNNFHIKLTTVWSCKVYNHSHTALITELNIVFDALCVNSPERKFNLYYIQNAQQCLLETCLCVFGNITF